MKILFFGLGSIGKRHARLIEKYYNHDLFAYRTKKGQEENDLSIQEFYDYEKAFSIQPDIVFITNPTFLHIDTAMKCADRGIDMFIEKPLSNDFDRIEELKEKVKEKNLFVYIAHCMRFHPVIHYLKENIDVDQVMYTKTTATSYLPNWRSKQKYHKSFSVDSKKGGGVLLELIHEIDYNNWLFGDIEKITGSYGKISDFKSDCEDFAELFIIHKNDILGNIHLDWFSYNNERRVQIYCSDKYIEGGLRENYVYVKKNNGETKKIEYNVERDDIYKLQLDYFFNCYKKNRKPMNNIFEASKVLKKVLNFKANTEFINHKK
ncbi:MAG: Gfo/Idh/MocA family oxidoreductase [Candidatus Thermoplasmatota archaeon]